MDFAQLGMKVDTGDIDRATQSLNKLDKSATGAESSADKASKSMGSFGQAVSAASRLVGALAAGLSINSIIQYSDVWTNVGNQLRMVTTSTEQFTSVQAGVVAVAKATYSELGATASLYSTLARYTGDLVSSDTELLRITETLNKAFIVSGASAQTQEGAIRQLSQALASGALRGDEYNSVNENAPRIMDAVAASLNMTKGELRSFAAEGGITSEILVTAVKDMADEIDRDFNGMTKTFGMFVQNARTNLAQFIGESQIVTGAVQLMGGTLLLASENLDTLADAAAALAIVYLGRMAPAVVAFVDAKKAEVTALTAARQAQMADVHQRELRAISIAAETKAIEAKNALEVENIRVVQATLVAERELEVVRLQAQINQIGRTASLTRLSEIRSAELAMTRNLTVAEAALAEARLASAAADKAVVASNAAVLQAKNAQITVLSRLKSAFSGLITLLGGPWGAAITAAVAGIYFWNRSGEDAYAITTDLSRSVEALADSYLYLGDAQRELAMNDVNRQIAETYRLISEQEANLSRSVQALETARKMGDIWGYAPDIEERILKERAELERLGAELAKLVETRSEYQKITDSATESTNRSAEAAGKLTDKQKELIASLRNELAALDMTEREAFIYQTTLKLGEDASAALTEEVKTLAGALFDQKGALKEAEEAQKKASDAAKQYREDVSRLLDELHPVDAALRDITTSQNLLFDALVDGIIGAEQYAQGMAALDAEIVKAKESTEKLSKESKEMEKAYERSIERIRDVIGDFFQNILLTGKLTFDIILDSFKRLIAEMIATAAANKVLIGIGMAGASGAASASGMLGSAGGISGMLGKLTDVGGILNAAGTLFSDGVVGLGQILGGKAGQAVFDLYGVLAKTGTSMGLSGGGAVLGGAALTAGAGILGGAAGKALGESLFGKQAHSNWGAAIGGILGASAGPIGSAIGAALGGALDAFVGGDGKQRVTLGVETNPYAQAGGRGYANQFMGASGIAYTARATRADEAAANQMAQMFASLDNALTGYVTATTGRALDLSGQSLSGRSSQAGLAVQDSGINSFFGSAEFNQMSEQALLDAIGQFIQSWFNAAESAMGQDIPMARLLRDFGGTTEQLLAMADALATLSSAPGFAAAEEALGIFDRLAEFQGSPEALVGLAQALTRLVGISGIDASTRSLSSAVSILERYAGSGEQLAALAEGLGVILTLINRNPVADAIEAQRLSQMSMLDQYKAVNAEVYRLNLNYDGSLNSTLRLTEALAAQQGVAQQLAATYLQVQQQVGSLFGSLSESIRTSLMSEEELTSYQRDNIAVLTNRISSMTDPEAILAASQQIERLVSDMWGRLDAEDRAMQGDEFLAYLDDVNRIAQEQLDLGLADLQSTQEQINEAIRDGLDAAAAQMTLAAQNQIAATENFAVAVADFGYYINRSNARRAEVTN